MKLVCSVSVGNRLLPSHAISAKKKFVKSTLALCKHPNTDQYCMILFSGHDKNGTKYNLKGNIEKVLTKFVNEGKSTIQFKNPPHDLFIQADIIILKSFLHLMQRILKGTISPNELKCSSLGVTAVATKDIPPTKLVIQNRSEYPMKGFSRTLENLTITGIKRSGLDLGILKLSKLKTLNLSNNCISTLPEEVSQMLNLKVLDLSSNELHKSSKKEWKWLDGNLCRTLVSLNLSNNKLAFLPQQIIKLQNLSTLNVIENRLQTLPNGIGRLTKLRQLKIAQNILEELPGSMKNLKLDLIDISNNRFRDPSQDPPGPPIPTVLPVCTLKEYAAQRVLDLKLVYNAEIIPATLVSFLDHDAKYCICGKPSFSTYLHRFATLKLTTVADAVITSSTDFTAPYISIKCYCCSVSCSKVCQKVRVPPRGPLVR